MPPITILHICFICALHLIQFIAILFADNHHLLFAGHQVGPRPPDSGFQLHDALENKIFAFSIIVKVLAENVMRREPCFIREVFPERPGI